MEIPAFSTERFDVANWQPFIDRAEERANFEAALANILTPPVLAHLPPSLQLDDSARSVSHWIDARVAECDVLIVTNTGSNALVGLVFLFLDAEDGAQPTVHIGYLLAETVWGQGAATEILTGLVSVFRRLAPVHLVGGVDKANPASARVLEKAGFARSAEMSTSESDVFVLSLE